LVATQKSIVLSIGLLLANILLVGIMFLPAVFLTMASTGCREGCPMPVVISGIWIAVIAPSVVFVISLVVSIVKFVKHESAVKMAVIGLLGSFGAFWLGVALVFLAQI
jgi:hypothetical protein